MTKKILDIRIVNPPTTAKRDGGWIVKMSDGAHWFDSRRKAEKFLALVDGGMDIDEADITASGYFTSDADMQKKLAGF